jgi:hypothetical protein
MRNLAMAAVLAAAVGCIGAPLGRPAVMRNLTTLPSDGDKQHEQSESALARPGAEKRKQLSKRERQLETVAASVAVLVGMFYSATPNVLLGTESQLEENVLLDPTLGERERLAERRRKQLAKEKDADAEKAPSRPANDPEQPVPWIHLAPPPPVPTP